MRRHVVAVPILVIILILGTNLIILAQESNAKDGLNQAGDPPEIIVDNDFIRVAADKDGQFVIGTTGGDPSTPNDDNKRLLFGYPSDIWSSFATVRIITNGLPEDFRLLDRIPAEGPVRQGNAIITSWLINQIRVTQRLELAFNPYTGRDDTIRIEYSLANNGSSTRVAGVRSMIDIAIGRVGPVVEGDGAPYFVPGSGNMTREAEFRANIPAIWKAFESRDFAPSSTKGQGILIGPGATRPDRLVLARWGRFEQSEGIRFHAWDYTVDPSADLTLDSAVAMYWNPRDIAPGNTRTITTFYGLAGPGGGQAWIDAPVALACSDLSFSATHWIANTSDEPFSNGRATLALPPELELEEGELSQPLGTINPGAARSATWLLRPRAGASGSFTYSVSSQFDTGTNPLAASSSVMVPKCADPSGPTPTPVPRPTPVPPTEVPEASTFLLLASGLGALAGYARMRRKL